MCREKETQKINLFSDKNRLIWSHQLSISHFIHSRPFASPFQFKFRSVIDWLKTNGSIEWVFFKKNEKKREKIFKQKMPATILFVKFYACDCFVYSEPKKLGWNIDEYFDFILANFLFYFRISNAFLCFYSIYIAFVLRILYPISSASTSRRTHSICSMSLSY